MHPFPRLPFPLRPARPPRSLLIVPFIFLFLSHPSLAGQVPAISGMDALFSQFAGSEAGVAVVLKLGKECGTRGHETCLRLLEKWRKVERKHPLVAAAVDRVLAQELRIAGQLDRAEELISGLKYVMEWGWMAPDGTEVQLLADPASGIVHPSDFIEIPPGQPPVFFTRIDSPARSDVVLRIEAAGLERVCAGTTCVSVERFERPIFDQHVVPVTLEKGGTRVELTFSAETPPARFGMRVTSLTGKDPPRSVLEDLAGKEGASVRELLLACLLARSSGWSLAANVVEKIPWGGVETADDWVLALECARGDRRGLEAVRRAVAAFPDDMRIRLAEARYYAEIRAAPTAWTMLSNLCPGEKGALNPDFSFTTRAGTGSSRPDGTKTGAMSYPTGKQRIRQRPFACLDPHSRVVAALLAKDLLRQFGFDSMQEAILGELDEHPPDVVSARADILANQERYSEMAELLLTHLEKWPGDLQLASSAMYALEQCGRLADQRKIAVRLAFLYPTSSSYKRRVASLEHRLGNKVGARSLFSQMEAEFRFNPEVLEAAAEFRFSIGEIDRARELWEAVLKLRPHDDNIRDLLAHLRSETRADADLLLTNDEIRELARSVPDSSGEFEGIADRLVVRLHEKGGWTTRRTVAVKAIKPRVDSPLLLGFSYDSSVDDVTLVKPQVLRADGSVSYSVPVGDTSLSEEEYNLYYDIRSITATFDGLGSGDIAVLSYETETVATGFGAPFSGLVWLQGDYVRFGTSVELIVPEGVELFYSVSRGSSGDLSFEHTQETRDGLVYYLFRFPKLEAAANEPYPPPSMERYAHLHYSTMATHEEFGRWYSKAISAQMVADLPMKKFVEEINSKVTGDEGSRERRLALTETICRYVADEIRYVGLELGVHGLKPYSPIEVFRRKFGDCKDKSLLLVTLLREVGIPARVVAVSTAHMGKWGDEHPGSPRVYDHALVYLEEEGKYFDPTVRYLGLDALPWQDQGAHALILDDVSPRVVVIPPGSANEHRNELSLLVSGNDVLEVEGTARFTGAYARSALYYQEKSGSWENTVEEHASSVLPVVELLHIDQETVWEEFPEGRRPVFQVRFKGVWKPGGGGAQQLFPGVLQRLPPVEAPERKMDMSYAYPYVNSYEIEFKNHTFLPAEEVYVARKSNHASFEVVAHDSGSEVLVTVRFRQEYSRISPDEYPDYRDLISTLREVLLRLKGTVTARGGSR